MEFKKYLKGNPAIFNVIKKNLVSVMCGVVAIVAVVASFYPVNNWYAELQGKVARRAAIATAITGLETNPRSLPAVIPNAPPVPLTIFPTSHIIDQANALMATVHSQSTGMLTTAVTLNQHVPLDADALLANATDLTLTRFRQEYLHAVDDDARIRAWPPADVADNARQRNITLVPLRSCRRPTPDDITQALDQLQQDINTNTLVPSSDPGKYTDDSVEQAKEAYDDKSRTKPLEVEFDRATHGKVYIEPGAFKVADAYMKIKTAQPSPARADIWDAQRILWIQEDVASGVAFANARARDVLDAPVKQILNVSMDTPWVINPQNSTAAEDTALPVVYDSSPTGHITNGMYEVLHFTVELDVDARQVAFVLAALEHDQYMTIWNVQATSKDASDSIGQRFIYGSAPIVDLKLNCEELMLKQWIVNYEPAVNAGSGTTAQPASPDQSAP